MVLDPAVLDRWRWVRRRLRPGVRTLDAGSGSGWFALYFAHRGNETVGVSFDARNNQAARRRAALLKLDLVSFYDGDLRELGRFGRELGEFDQVVCLETIEHILDGRRLITDLAARLRPGGQLLLTTPYRHHRPLHGERISAVEDGGHVRPGYTHSEVGELITAAGMEVIEEVFLSGVVTQAMYNLQARMIERVGLRLAALLAQPLRALQLIDRPLTRLTRRPYLCIAVAAQK